MSAALANHGRSCHVASKPCYRQGRRAQLSHGSTALSDRLHRGRNRDAYFLGRGGKRGLGDEEICPDRVASRLPAPCGKDALGWPSCMA